MKPKLNEKQKLFIDYYIQSGNATQAAKKAGYSPNTAYAIGEENLRKLQIQAAIQSRLAQLESERIAKDKEVLEYITAVMRGEMEEEVVVNVGTGKGMFITRQEVDLQGVIPVVICDDI